MGATESLKEWLKDNSLPKLEFAHEDENNRYYTAYFSEEIHPYFFDFKIIGYYSFGIEQHDNPEFEWLDIEHKVDGYITPSEELEKLILKNTHYGY